METDIGQVHLSIVRGDITKQSDVDAVINAANAQLAPGGCVAGAIHRAAGPELARACRPLAPIAPGEAVITPAFRLPNRYVIHCLGPVYGVDHPESELLASCYRNALRLAEVHGLGSIACVAISTGIFGYPMAEAAKVALGTVLEEAPRLHTVRLVRFCLADEKAQALFEQTASSLLSAPSGGREAC